MVVDDIKKLLKDSFKVNSCFGLTAIKETVEILEHINKTILTIEIKYNEATSIKDVSLYPTIIIYKKEITIDKLTDEILLEAYIDILNALVCNGCIALVNLYNRLNEFKGNSAV